MLACATNVGGGSNRRLSCDTDSMVDMLEPPGIFADNAPAYGAQSNDCGLRGATCRCRFFGCRWLRGRSRSPQPKMLEFAPGSRCPFSQPGPVSGGHYLSRGRPSAPEAP